MIRKVSAVSRGDHKEVTMNRMIVSGSLLSLVLALVAPNAALASCPGNGSHQGSSITVSNGGGGGGGQGHHKGKKKHKKHKKNKKHGQRGNRGNRGGK